MTQTPERNGLTNHSDLIYIFPPRQFYWEQFTLFKTE